jgi:hypothetical protein
MVNPIPFKNLEEGAFFMVGESPTVFQKKYLRRYAIFQYNAVAIEHGEGWGFVDSEQKIIEIIYIRVGRS